MRKIITIAAIAVLAPLAVFAQTDGTYDRSYVRMSYVQGDVYVQRSGDLGYQAGEVNLVVVAGDKIGTRAGRLELQLGRQNYVRLDADTVVEMAALPSADAQPTKIHLLAGSLFVRVNSLGDSREFEVHTPDASFYILSEGLYRLDVRSGRETALQVVEGEAEASGEQGSIVAHAGEGLVVSNGQFVTDGAVAEASNDDFRVWNDSREAQYARSVSQSYLPAEYAEYETELADNGNWTYEPDYGYVWVPRVSVVDWRPYAYGRWAWYPIIGWTWVSYEPWGWCTYHYGRWGWGAHLGWYWIPRHHWGWGPAWVHWYWDSYYIGWSPLSYWGYPGHLVNGRFYDRYMNYGFPRDSRSLMMVRRDQLQDRNLRGRFLGGESLARIGRDSLRNGQPDLKPSLVRSGEMANRARTVLSGSAVRGVARSYGANSSRPAPESLRQSVIRKSGSSSGLERRPVGSVGGVNSGNPIIRREGAAGNPPASPGLTRSRALDPGADRSASGSTGTARNLREFPSRRTVESGSPATAGRSASGTVRSPETLRPRTSGTESRTIRENPSRSTESRVLRSPSGSSESRSIRENPSRSEGSRTIRSGTADRSNPTSSSSSRILRAPSGSGTSSSSPARTLRSPGSSGSASAPRMSSSPSRALRAPSRSTPSSSRSVLSSRPSSGSSRSSSPSRSLSAPSRSSSPSRSSGSVSRSSGGASRSSGSAARGRIRK